MNLMKVLNTLYQTASKKGVKGSIWEDMIKHSFTIIGILVSTKR